MSFRTDPPRRLSALNLVNTGTADFFKSEKPREVYRSEYEQTEKEYSILNKLIISDRKETAELAKNILKHPFYLSQSKGNYKYPKTIDYSISNYCLLNIFL